MAKSNRNSNFCPEEQGRMGNSRPGSEWGAEGTHRADPKQLSKGVENWTDT